MNNWSYGVAACTLALWGSAAQAQKAPAAPATPAAAPETAWQLICPKAPAEGSAPATSAPAHGCGLVQNLVAGEQKQRLLTLIVKRSTATAYNLTIALPHGLLFPPGVALQVDETPERTLVVQTSDQNGAYSGTPIDGDLLKALRGGKTLKVTFSSGSGQRIMVPVTLKDFATGMTALDKTPVPPVTPSPAPAKP